MEEGTMGKVSGRFVRRALPFALAIALSAFLGSTPAWTGVLGGLFGESAADRAKKAGVSESAKTVAIPLSSLESGKALFLQVAEGGLDYYFFAIRSGDGKYHAALDACDVCFRAAKGYRQDGGALVCNNCDMKFDPARLGQAKGGCNPHPLAARVEGSSLVIDRAEILAGKRFFTRKRA
jgi:uncharacterized membrane protein